MKRIIQIAITDNINMKTHKLIVLNNERTIYLRFDINIVCYCYLYNYFHIIE